VILSVMVKSILLIRPLSPFWFLHFHEDERGHGEDEGSKEYSEDIRPGVLYTQVRRENSDKECEDDAKRTYTSH